ncbi:hypothetical protein NEAUS03_0535 [Nematocida ausubeli]|nr:hypothetical protein NEAUS03_0535 [Nematocida ausubeli]
MFNFLEIFCRMDEGRFYSKVLQAVVVEILNQVGFERTSKQSLQIIIDLVFSQINQKLLRVKDILSGSGLCEAYNRIGEEKEEIDKDLLDVILLAIIQESTGCEDSYRRKELVSFLQYQLNITKQIKKEAAPQDESLLEILRVGDQLKKTHIEERALINFTGEEEGEKKAPEEKKYLDQDVQEHLKERANICVVDGNVSEPHEIFGLLQGVKMEDPIVEINPARTDYLIRNNMRDYEHMLNRKRLSTLHCTPCESQVEIPFLEDILLLSTLRKVPRKRKEVKEKEWVKMEDVSVE